MDRYYEFVGVVNLFNIYPDFVFPIYVYENEFFFHNGIDNIILSFEQITDSIRNKIIFKDSKEVLFDNECTKKHFFVNDAPIYAFQDDEKKVFCAELDDMIIYLRQFHTNDKILSMQIERFIEESKIDDYLYVNPYNKAKRFNGSSILAEHGAYCFGATLLYYGFEEGEAAYKIDSELYSVDYCMCGPQNIDITSTNFEELQKDFHNLIVKITYDSPYYEILIKCQKAIIDKNERELIMLINRNYQVFLNWIKEGIMESYLEYYVMHHKDIQFFKPL